ncbi:MAG TPA: hypothetical protein VF158_04830 [Longimicrobiales bacterium]
MRPYPAAASRVCGKAVKHAAFALVMALFVLYGGQNWHVYAATLMTAAWVRHGGRLNARIF